MKNKRKSALWALLWANVVMLFVMLGTYFVMRYFYVRMISYAIVTVQINPVVIIIAYLIGMLILWGIIYKYLVSEPKFEEDTHQNHNIY